MNSDLQESKLKGPFLIETAPQYRQYMKAKSAREIVQRILTPLEICSIAVIEYRSELMHMLDSQAIYLGPGK